MKVSSSEPSLHPVSPLVLMMLLVVLGGTVFGLNRVNAWLPVGLFLACTGMALVAFLHSRERKRDRQELDVVDYRRLASVNLPAQLPWLRQNVRGHDAVIEVLCHEIDRNLRLARPGRTLGAFLLVGPTGTGKTFLAQLIAEALYPSSLPLLLRMNSYKHADDVFTLIGPPPGKPGYEVGGTLTRPVLQNPYRVIILDELEKCHADLHHCLYDILDVGNCREKSSGKLVDFSASVFFATCNAGVEGLRAIHRTSSDPVLRLGRSRDALADAGGFDKAFLARWSGIFLMDQLSPLHIAEVACLQLARYWRDYGIEVDYAAPELILEAVERNEEFRNYGVRQLGALIQAQTNSAIIQAREQGLARVRLEAGTGGGLQIRATPRS
jgi:ATP-dependent Clp protease ATP-binding subunit ClpA